MRNIAPLLQVERLTRTFGGLSAVSALDLAFDHGELVSVIGPKGAGKTTLFNLISGLDVPQIIRRGISSLPEGRRLFSAMTVRENLLMGAFFPPRPRGSAIGI